MNVYYFCYFHFLFSSFCYFFFCVSVQRFFSNERKGDSLHSTSLNTSRQFGSLFPQSSSDAMHPFLPAPRMHVPDHPFLEMNPLWFGPFNARYRHVWGHWFTPTYETSCTLWKKLHTYIYETSCLLHMHRRKAMINDHQPLLEFNFFLVGPGMGDLTPVEIPLCCLMSFLI